MNKYIFSAIFLVLMSGDVLLNQAKANEAYCVCTVDGWDENLENATYFISGIYKAEDEYSCGAGFNSHVLDVLRGSGIPWCDAFDDYYEASDERVRRATRAESKGMRLRTTNWRP